MGGHVSPRQDVGLKIAVGVEGEGAPLLLGVTSEMSMPDDAGAIHKLVVRDSASVPMGQPVLVTRVSDANGAKRYELTVTATKVK